MMLDRTEQLYDARARLRCLRVQLQVTGRSLLTLYSTATDLNAVLVSV